MPPRRNEALDAYRGFVMLLMMAEVLHLSRVAAAHPGNGPLAFLASQQTHVAWTGCSLHDLIQPSFSFLVGAALPYSIASRIARGELRATMFAHALWRAVLLVGLGILLRSIGRPQLNFTFEDTLTQIGLGYPLLFALGFLRPKWQWSALAALLVGYWLFFVLYPSADGTFTGHWAKNANAGAAFDRWFMNLFPRVKPFLENGGGYLTLSFIPTLGTMILGLIAGQWIRSGRRDLLPTLWIAAAAGIGAGLAAHYFGLVPVVKRIWTPSWVLFSGGCCFALAAAFHYLIEERGWRRWAMPLVVIGVNSIAAYLIAHLWAGFLFAAFQTLSAGALPQFAVGLAVLGTYCLALFWMWRRRIFLRI